MYKKAARPLAILLLVITVGLLHFGNVRKTHADQPEHFEGIGAQGYLVFGDVLPLASVSTGCGEFIPDHATECVLSVAIYDYSVPTDYRLIFGWTFIDESRLIIDKSLASASITDTIDGVICHFSESPQRCIPITMGVDVQWTATGRPITRPLGITKIEECGPHAKGIGWEMTREAVLSGTITINSVPFTSTGSILGLLTRDTFPHMEGPTCD